MPPDAAPVPPPGPFALRERESQLDAVDAALVSAAAGRGRVLVVVGAAGLGKTSLLRAARERSAEARVLTARPGEMERHLPFGAVRQLLDPVLATASAQDRAALLSGAAALAEPVLGAGPAEPAETDGGDRELFATLHGLYWLLANIANIANIANADASAGTADANAGTADQPARPLLVVLDDAQWADRPSLAFAELLARRCEDLPVVLLVGTRPLDADAPPELSQLLADPTVDRLPLAPLSAGAVASMLRDGVGPPAHDAFVAACLAETGGNPFLLTELLHEVEAQGLAPTEDTARRVGTLAPDGVSAAIQLRLARTTPAARAVAESLALLGDGVSTALLGALAGLDEPVVRDVARLLAQGGLVTVGEAGLSFAHPLMRTTVLAASDPLSREEGHRRAAGLLAERGDEVGAVAAHLHQTQPRGDAATVAALRQAARSARALADPNAAAAHLARALAEPPAPDELPGLLVELGQAEAAAGLPDAEEHLRRAVQVAPDAGARAAAVLALARTLKFRRGAVDAVRLLSDELPDMPAAPAAEAEWELLALGFASSGARRALADRVTAVPSGAPGGSTGDADFAPLFAAAFRAFNLAASGGSRDAVVADARKALAPRPLPLDPMTVAGFASLSAGVACYWAGDLTVAEQVFTEMLDAARSAGSPVAASTLLGLRALIAWRRGDLPDCAEDAREAVALVRGLSVVPPLVAAAHSAGALVVVERSLSDAALRDVDRTLATARLDPDGTPFAEVLYARGVVNAALGDLDQAADLLAAAGREFIGWGALNPAVQPWRSDLARVRHAQGATGEAEALVAEELRLAEDFGAPRTVAVALAARAATVGTEPEADLRRALALLESDTPARLVQARVLVDLGALLRRTGRTAEARERLAAARELAVRCGADRTAEAAREELVASGVRPRRVAVSGVDSLTGAERRVARLAARGRSNRGIAQELFVSEKTVETHLGRAYAKLGISSRSALPGALGAAGDGTAG